MSRPDPDRDLAEANECLDVINPATEEILDTVPLATAADVDAAVVRARDAFPAWAATPLPERLGYLAALADELERRTDDLTALITAEVGTPLSECRSAQVGLPIAVLRDTVDVAAAHPWRERCGRSEVWREPAGVVGAITPWNFPLHQIVAKLGPALAAGCAFVLKPSEVAPLNALVLFDALKAVGLPPGVANLVLGTGAVVGEAIAGHPGVDVVSFTGSVRAGTRVAEAAARNITRVALELGGKSPNVILPDADFERAVSAGVGQACVNAGQACIALSRMLVPADRLAEAEDLARRTAERIVVGDPFDPSTTMGPVVSAAQRDRIRGFVTVAVNDGARVIAGGPDTPAGLDRGFFVRPTVLSGVTSTMTVSREEVFGPVLVLLPYRDENEAVTLANDTPYGLSAGVWSSDPDHAHHVAARLRAGQVKINGARTRDHIRAPFGGYKRSGIGRELGPFGLDEFLEIKAVLT
ncbi:MAG: aldehyde dehydrogenase [Actinomycetota bacterium]|nr:aldehyde dehydrogenase [Actinomycetota bacterium]